ncbi:MAG TPA: hypothetical protein VFF23_11875 [Hanamia sp.]|nr:hypothetical protein [Hanamia sp.]
MDFKKLERATKIYEQLKQLDKEIIEIDRFAMLVANGEIKSSFELKIDDIGKKKEDSDKVGFDEDGSLIKGTSDSLYEQMRRSFYMPILSFGCDTGKETDKNVHLLKNELSENATMSILGVLLQEKQFKRTNLLTQLQRLGVVA